MPGQPKDPCGKRDAGPKNPKRRMICDKDKKIKQLTMYIGLHTSHGCINLRPFALARGDKVQSDRRKKVKSTAYIFSTAVLFRKVCTFCQKELFWRGDRVRVCVCVFVCVLPFGYRRFFLLSTAVCHHRRPPDTKINISPITQHPPRLYFSSHTTW